MARLAGLLGLLSVGVIAAHEDRPIVVVHKSLAAPETEDYLVEGSKFSAVYIVQNVGTKAAVEVKLEDEWPADNFEIVEGDAVATWAELAPGANETHTVVLRPRVRGQMNSAKAKLAYKYKEEADSTEAADADAAADADLIDITAWSTAPGRVEILSHSAFEKATVNADLWHSAATYVSVALLAIPFMAWRKAGAPLAAHSA